MKVKSQLQAVFALALSLGLLTVGIAQTPPSTPKPANVKFTKVMKLLKTNCVSCHNSSRHPEAVNLSSYKAIMASGEKGSIVVPGKPEESKIIMYVDGEKTPQMPFKKTALTSAQVDLLKAWVAEGAPK